MPGPGNKKVKGKGKKTTSLSNRQRPIENKGKKHENGSDAPMDPKMIAFINDMNETEEWKVCADILCNFLGLPGSYVQQLLRSPSERIHHYVRLIYA